MITPQYLAGLIDGEGYLGLLPSRARGLTVTSFEPVVKMGMTGLKALEVMQVMKGQYGGNIYKSPKLTKGLREAYTYTLKSRRKVSELLLDILPYLHIKHAQALVLIEFCELPSSHTRYVNFDPEVVQRKLEIYEEMRKFKQPDALAETN